jgi:RNA polymerase sigma factor (sigma-70 family)
METALVACTSEPDGDAWLRGLYERHFDTVFRYAASRVGSQVAEDVVAETFAIAFTRRAAFDRSHGSALPWLIGIARNLLRSHRRAERRHFAAAAGRFELRAVSDTFTDETIARADAAAVRAALVRAVRRLPSAEREAFMVHALAGLRGAELGVALGVSPSAAAVRLHRARARLLAALRDDLPGQEED